MPGSSRQSKNSIGSLSGESTSSLLMEESSVKRSRQWAITTQAAEGVYHTENAVVYVGPTEQDQGQHGSAHALIISVPRTGQQQANKLSKSAVVKLLNELGISNTYIGHVKDMYSYIRYMYKTKRVSEEDKYPAGLKDVLRKQKQNPHSKTARQGQLMENIAKVNAMFSTKPSMNEYRSAMISTNGLSTPELVIKRGYDLWKNTHKSRFQNKMAKFSVQNAPKKMTLEVMVDLFFEILQNVSKSTNRGLTISSWDQVLILSAAALEVRDTANLGIRLSNHIMCYGVAGSGKTLLCNLLFPAKNCSILTNDSSGVGQCAMGPMEKVLKVDDAEAAFFDNAGLISTVKTCYHNKWSAKIHGSKAVNPPVLCVVTTNETNPIGLMSQFGGREPYVRRFAQFHFDKKLNFSTEHYLIEDDMTDDLVDALCKTITTQAKECYDEELHPLYEYIRAFNECDTE